MRSRHGVAQPILNFFAHFGNASRRKAQLADQTDAERFVSVGVCQNDFDVAVRQRDVLLAGVDERARSRHFIDGARVRGAPVVNGVQLFRQSESQFVQLVLHVLQFGVAQGDQSAHFSR